MIELVIMFSLTIIGAMCLAYVATHFATRQENLEWEEMHQDLQDSIKAISDIRAMITKNNSQEQAKQDE